MLSPDFTANLRTTINNVVERRYLDVVENLQYQRVVKVFPESDAARQVITHAIESVILEDFGEFGGGVNYATPVIAEQEFKNHYQKTGLELPEAMFTDGGPNGEHVGVQVASEWVENATEVGAYWPQRRSIELLRYGTGSTFKDGTSFGKCYDGEYLFSQAHPYHFKHPTRGYFSNLLTGGSLTATGEAVSVTVGSITFPGFAPLAGPFGSASAMVTPEAAFRNLWQVLAYIKSIKLPDGITPAYLRPDTIVHGPKLTQNVSLITNAQWIAMNSGATEIKGTVTRMGLKEPIEFQELGGNTDINALEDWDWYIFCTPQIERSRIGSVIYAPREPFTVRMFAATSGNEGVNIELAEKDAVKWICKGRNATAVGLPQYVFKVQATRG
jgi:hypothetical protein